METSRAASRLRGNQFIELLSIAAGIGPINNIAFVGDRQFKHPDTARNALQRSRDGIAMVVTGAVIVRQDDNVGTIQEFGVLMFPLTGAHCIARRRQPPGVQQIGFSFAFDNKDDFALLVGR